MFILRHFTIKNFDFGVSSTPCYLVRMIPRDFRDFIRDAYQSRRSSRPSLSLSAFAREIQMSPQKLNAILKRGAGLSSEAARELSLHLGLRRKDRERFVTLVDSYHHRSSLVRATAQAKLRDLFGEADVDAVSVDEFTPIADLRSVMAFLLVQTKDFKPDMKWAARRLKLTESDTAKTYDRLFKLGFLRIEGAKWLCDSSCFDVEASRATPSLQNYYRQLTLKAREFLDRESEEARHFASIVVSVSEGDIDFIRDEIDSFRKSLMVKLDQRTATADRIFALNLQLFPLDEARNQ